MQARQGSVRRRVCNAASRSRPNSNRQAARANSRSLFSCSTSSLAASWELALTTYVLRKRRLPRAASGRAPRTMLPPAPAATAMPLAAACTCAVSALVLARLDAALGATLMISCCDCGGGCCRHSKRGQGRRRSPGAGSAGGGFATKGVHCSSGALRCHWWAALAQAATC